MRWQFTYGEQAETLTTVAKKTGKIPQALLDRPELLFPDIWSLYQELSASRDAGFTVGHIKHRDFLALCEVRQIGESRYQLWEIFCEVERELLRLVADQNKKSQEKAKANGSANRNIKTRH